MLSCTDASSSSRSTTDFTACHYHRAGWPRIARLSIEALAIGPDASDDYVPACENVIWQHKLRRRDQGWLISLFTQPVDWRPGLVSVKNGQHRICALRAAGVTECVVRTN